VAASRRNLAARIRVLERELGNVRGKEGMREWSRKEKKNQERERES
jgi:hypothetical protein